MQYEKSCGAVVFTREGGKIKYVIVQANEGHRGFPKGHVEGAETEEQTALREIREEVGLLPELLPGFRVVTEYPLPGRPGVIKQAVYFAAEYSGQQIKRQESEIARAVLCTCEEALGLLTYDNAKGILRKADAFIAGRAARED